MKISPETVPRNRLGIPRIRSVLLRYRPSFAFRPDSAPQDFSDSLNDLQAVWDECAASTGVVRVKNPETGIMEPFATAWRLPGEGVPRVATAGHVLMAMLEPGRDYQPTGFPIADTDVAFGDDDQPDPSRIFPVKGALIAHPRWDLCVLELDVPPGADLPPALNLAPPQAAGAPPVLQTDMRVAVIGYPSRTEDTFSQIWRRHISPGIINGGSVVALALNGTNDARLVLKNHQDRDPESANATHDASTCPGFSGAPVIDVQTRHVVGVHIAGSGQSTGSQFFHDWNDLVDICALHGEDWVAAALSGGDVTGHEPLGLGWPLGWASVRSPEGGLLPRARSANALAERLHRLRPSYLGAGIVPDRPDFRDRPFVPCLARPAPQVRVEGHVPIGNQGGSANCAAYALAAALEPQLTRDDTEKTDLIVSVAMLDALAREHDEFMDNTVEGTSLRGVLKGFFHNGVCRASVPGAITAEGQPFLLTRRMAKDARNIRLGSYFRVAPDLGDMQMAVQETKGVLVSAYIHKGWNPPVPFGKEVPPPLEDIKFDDLDSHPRLGAHAFLVTGYDAKGFIVQNSWGKDWGRFTGHPGHARWSYADWAANVIDAWVVRLAAPTPAGFGLIAAAGSTANALPAPRRSQLLGHMIHTERDWIVEQGTLGLGLRAIDETVRFLSAARDQAADDRKAARKYRRIALVFHDPMQGDALIARIAARMTPEFKARATYALHVCHGLDEMRTLALRLVADAEQVRDGFAQSLVPPWRYLERRVAVVSQRLVENYREGAVCALDGPLGQALGPLLSPPILDPSEVMPKGRQLVVLAAGLGAIPAMACARLIGDRACPVFLAPPVQVPVASKIWRLGMEQREHAIPGYPGEWSDLLAATLGEDASPRGAPRRNDPAGRWGDLSSALIDPRLIARLCS